MLTSRRKRIVAILGVVVVIVLVIVQLICNNFLPTDPTIGRILYGKNPQELSHRLVGKTALVIGGTRGIGYGIALNLAEAGAKHITLVGRKESSGQKAIQQIRKELSSSSSVPTNTQITFLQGDIGTLCSTKALIDRLVESDGDNEETRETPKMKYDYLVVTAATWPNWDYPLLNEDGIDKSIFIATIGRFLVYRNMHRFLNYENNPTSDDDDGTTPRVLNVFNAGHEPVNSFNREIMTGKKLVSNLFESISVQWLGNEIMLQVLYQNHSKKNNKFPTMVSTAPGMLQTDLHRGQGLWFDVLEIIIAKTMGISEELCGLRQTSILVSDRLLSNQISYVDEYGQGRQIQSSKLEKEVQQHADWFSSFLMNFELNQRHCSKGDGDGAIAGGHDTVDDATNAETSGAAGGDTKSSQISEDFHNDGGEEL